MKKIITVLFYLMFSIISIGMTLELKGGIDMGTEDDSTTSLDLASGYSVRADLLFGDIFEFGVGVAYHEFGETESSTAAYDGKSYLTTQAVYGVVKMNFGSQGFNPYIRLNAGISTSQSGDFFDTYEDLIEAIYVTAGADSASVSVDIGTGLYGGLGIGLEYNSFLVELVYEAIAATLDISGTTTTSGTTTSIPNLTANDITINVLTLEVGYRFGEGSN